MCKMCKENLKVISEDVTIFFLFLFVDELVKVDATGAAMR